MTCSRALHQLAQRLHTQSLTLTHALQEDGDLQVLMEISYEISLLSSQFRDQILAALVEPGSEERLDWGRQEESAD